jgi:hypothetical protein
MSMSISNPHHASSALMCISLTACRVAVRAGTDKWRVRRAACVFAACILHSAHCMSIKWSAVRPGHFWIPSACDNSQACRVSGMHIHHKYGIL